MDFFSTTVTMMIVVSMVSATDGNSDGNTVAGAMVIAMSGSEGDGNNNNDCDCEDDGERSSDYK